VNETVSIRRVAQVFNGGTPTAEPGNWGGDVPWATPTDLAPRDGGLLTQTERSLTRFGARTGSAVVPAGSIIMSTRAPIGYLVQCNREMAFNQGCRGLVPTNRILPRFFQHALTARVDELKALGTGSTFQELSTEALGSLKIYLPPQESQRRIADFLDDQVARIDAAIQLRLRQREMMDDRLRASLDNIFVEASRENRQVRRLLAAPPQYGLLPVTPVSDREDWPRYIRTTDIADDGSLHGHTFKSIDPSESVGYIVEPGDVLVSRAGSIGTCAVISETTGRAVFAGYLVRLQFRDFRPRLFRHFTNSSLFLEQVATNVIQSTIQNFNAEKYASLSMPYIEPSRQQLAEKKLDALESSTEALRRGLSLSIGLHEERRWALITAAVTEEFDVSSAGSRAAAAVAG